jgi:hypothetical protein
MFVREYRTARLKDRIAQLFEQYGAANILRKVVAKLGLNLDGVIRGALIAPLKVQIWAVQESPRLKTGEYQFRQIPHPSSGTHRCSS